MDKSQHLEKYFDECHEELRIAKRFFKDCSSHYSALSKSLTESSRQLNRGSKSNHIEQISLLSYNMISMISKQIQKQAEDFSRCHQTLKEYGQIVKQQKKEISLEIASKAKEFKNFQMNTADEESVYRRTGDLIALYINGLTGNVICQYNSFFESYLNYPMERSLKDYKKSLEALREDFVKVVSKVQDKRHIKRTLTYDRKRIISEIRYDEQSRDHQKENPQKEVYMIEDQSYDVNKIARNKIITEESICDRNKDRRGAPIRVEGSKQGDNPQMEKRDKSLEISPVMKLKHRDISRVLNIEYTPNVKETKAEKEDSGVRFKTRIKSNLMN